MADGRWLMADGTARRQLDTIPGPHQHIDTTGGHPKQNQTRVFLSYIPMEYIGDGADRGEAENAGDFPLGVDRMERARHRLCCRTAGVQW